MTEPTKRWQDIARDRKRKQEESIPKEWRIQLPDEGVLNMIAIPAACNLLDIHELEITEEQDVKMILEKIHSGTWTALQVTTAFLKRAAIAHQLVSGIEIIGERQQGSTKFRRTA
jgi:amidase